MKTTIAILLGSLMASSGALADRSATSADFIGGKGRRHIDASLVASSATNPIDPTDVIAFAHDRATLTPSGYAQVDAMARWLKDHPRHRLVVEGHTDSLGGAPYNEDLATQRINTVRRRLLEHRLSPDQIVMLTFGEREATPTPLNPEQRRVVVFATTMSPQAVIGAARESRDLVYASWTDRGVLMQQRGTMISRR